MTLSHFLTLLTFTNDKWHTILHIKDLEDATPKSKMKQKIRQMFQTKRAKIIFKNSILLHFLTVLAYTNGKRHKSCWRWQALGRSG